MEAPRLLGWSDQVNLNDDAVFGVKIPWLRRSNKPKATQSGARHSIL